jgi:HEAT repeat protein
LSAVDDSSAVITPEDAEKLRDLALIWWSEYYPDQLQSLLTQMYGWNAPGAKYDVAVILKWLESQDELIRDRITELVNQKKASLDR